MATVTSAQSGNWDDWNTWVGFTIDSPPPGAGDTVIIDSGHTVEISNITLPDSIEVNGILLLDSGADLQFPDASEAITGSGLVRVLSGAIVVITAGSISMTGTLLIEGELSFVQGESVYGAVAVGTLILNDGGFLVPNDSVEVDTLEIRGSGTTLDTNGYNLSITGEGSIVEVGCSLWINISAVYLAGSIRIEGSLEISGTSVLTRGSANHQFVIAAGGAASFPLDDAYSFDATYGTKPWLVLESSSAQVWANYLTIGIADSNVLPAEADVRDAVDYDGGLKTGTLNLPAIANVRDGTTFDGATKTGTLDLPAEADVKEGVEYDGATKTGTLVAGSGGAGMASIYGNAEIYG